MFTRGSRLWLALVAVGAAVMVLTLPGAAGASPPQATIVSANPADFTPNVIDDGAVSNAAVYALEQSADGATIYAGGTFRTVRRAGSSTNITRFNLMSFGATTGLLTSLAPNINGPVWAIRSSGNSIYIGGEFSSVNGSSRRALAKINATTGALDPAFQPSIPSGNITEIRLVGGRLIVSGTFPKKLAALNPTTGADTGYINLGISGRVSSNSGTSRVYKFAVNPLENRLVALGNFTTVGGQERYRAFMLDLGPTATLSTWYYPPLKNLCRASSIPDYMRDVDFSPDGRYFVFVSTGFIPNPGRLNIDLCDATTRFETATLAPMRPTWINYTGGDTLHSVAVTGAAVYVQGHQRWLDNPFGADSPGPGSVDRPGIGAINPTTGKAFSWNPTKSRDVGGKDFLVTATGLWVASDGRYFAGEQRWGIAFCPL